MKDGFYWGDCILNIEGETSGVILVKDGVGYLYGFAFKLSAFDFGTNPKAIDIPNWLIEKKMV